MQLCLKGAVNGGGVAGQQKKQGGGARGIVTQGVTSQHCLISYLRGDPRANGKYGKDFYLPLPNEPYRSP